MSLLSPKSFVYADHALRPLVADIASRNNLTLIDLEQIAPATDFPCDANDQGELLVVLRPESAEHVSDLITQIRQVAQQSPHVLLVCETDSHEKIIAAIEGASFSVLPSNASLEQLESEILRALKANNHQSTTLESEAQSQVIQICNSLTASELDVLCGILDGGMNKTIASQLDLSERTIENRRRKIFDRFGTHSVAVITRMISESIGCEAVFRMREERHPKKPGE